MIGNAARHEQGVQAGRARFQQTCAAHAERERGRRGALAQLETDHHRRAREVSELKRAVGACLPEAVATYVDLVLNVSLYPDGFPQHWRLAYVPESRQLVVEYDLPGIDVIPTVKAYRYVKPPTPSPKRRANRRRSRPNTPRCPCLLTLRTTREIFAELDLRRVDPAACLRHLGAEVPANPKNSPRSDRSSSSTWPSPRFIEESDIIGGLDERPNLLAMSPTEFEGLTQNLFTRMGLDTR